MARKHDRRKLGGKYLNRVLNRILTHFAGTIGNTKEPRLDESSPLHLDLSARFERVFVPELFVNGSTDLDCAGKPGRLHAAGDVDRGAPKIVDELRRADDS